MFGKKSTSVKLTKDSMYDLIKNAFETNGLKYNGLDDQKVIQTGFMGDDLPIALNIYVDDLAIRFVSMLNLKAEPENFSKVAWELNCINKKLKFGCFYLDPDDGFIMFEYGFPYAEADVSEGFILAFTKMVADTVDAHDGDLKKIAERTQRSSAPDNMYG